MTRRLLARWAGWFAAANGLLFALSGLRFLIGYPVDNDGLGLLYTGLAFIGHFASLAALPVILLVLPLGMLVPRRALITAVAVLLEALLLALLVVDGNVFAEQRYHLTPLTAVLFETGTWVFVGFIALMALAFEALLAGAVWRWVEGAPRRRGGWIAASLIGVWLGGQGIHIWADAIGHTPVTQLTRYLPAYFPIHAKRTLARWGLVDPAVIERQRQLQRAGSTGGGQLLYPREPLQCTAPEAPKNLLFIIVDALRPDAVEPTLLPHLARLGAEGQTFANHWSGGNSSKAGLFSLFYALPSTYQETFYGVQRAPVLIEQARARGYAFGLFSAPGFSTPTDIGRTVFAGTPGLPMENRAEHSVSKNRAVTRDWLRWLAARDASRPFFGFLYYDPPVGETPPGGLPPGDGRFADDPGIEDSWRKYRYAAQLIDAEVGRVLDSLHSAGLNDSTVVVAVSDHGYEFDDNGLGYRGHASNFSAAQLRATLLIRWPGRLPAVHRHRSSHYDLPVTLMQEVFGCTNDPADYALGQNLFTGADWDWLLAGSYNAHAIVRPDQVIVTHPGGFVEVLGPDYRPLSGAKIDAAVVAEALGAMRRFYR